jgi:hypothetical protein
MKTQKRKFCDCSLIEIKVGNPVYYPTRDEQGIVKHISIVPNGNVSTDRSLIALLKLKMMILTLVVS